MVALSHPCGEIASNSVDANAIAGIRRSDCAENVTPGVSTIPAATATTDAMKTPMDPSTPRVVLTELSVGTTYRCFPHRVPTGSPAASPSPPTRYPIIETGPNQILPATPPTRVAMYGTARGSIGFDESEE